MTAPVAATELVIELPVPVTARLYASEEPSSVSVIVLAPMPVLSTAIDTVGFDGGVVPPIVSDWVLLPPVYDAARLAVVDPLCEAMEP